MSLSRHRRLLLSHIKVASSQYPAGQVLDDGNDRREGDYMSFTHANSSSIFLPA